MTLINRRGFLGSIIGFFSLSLLKKEPELVPGKIASMTTEVIESGVIELSEQYEEDLWIKDLEWDSVRCVWTWPDGSPCYEKEGLYRCP